MTGLDDQLAMNRETLQALRDNGVADGQSLDVDAFFFAPDQAASSALVAALTADGWRAQADAERRGLVRKRTVWSVQATRPVPADGDALDAMVTRLSALADEHAAEFDGWGAEVPDQGLQA